MERPRQARSRETPRAGNFAGFAMQRACHWRVPATRWGARGRQGAGRPPDVAVYRNGQPARAQRTRSSSSRPQRSERRDLSAAPLVNGTDSVPEPQSLSLVSRSTLNTNSAPSFTEAWKPLLLATAAVLAAPPRMPPISAPLPEPPTALPMSAPAAAPPATAPTFRVRVEPAMMLSAEALMECVLPFDSIEVTRSTSTARSPLAAGRTPSTTPCTTLPAGNGAMLPTVTASAIEPVHSWPTEAVSELSAEPMVILRPVPA